MERRRITYARWYSRPGNDLYFGYKLGFYPFLYRVDKERSSIFEESIFLDVCDNQYTDPADSVSFPQIVNEDSFDTIDSIRKYIDAYMKFLAIVKVNQSFGIVYCAHGIVRDVSYDGRMSSVANDKDALFCIPKDSLQQYFVVRGRTLRSCDHIWT